MLPHGGQLVAHANDSYLRMRNYLSLSMRIARDVHI